MSDKIKLPRKTLDDIKDRLRSPNIVPNGKIEISMTKKELQALNDDAINFLEKYVDMILCRKKVLYEKPLKKFVRDKRYSEKDLAYFAIPLSDLIKAGVLRKVKRGEYLYWYLQDEVLDPRTYKWLYLVSEDTTRTLMNELGYLEIYEKYKNRFKVDHGIFYSHFAIIELDDLVLELDTTSLRVEDWLEIPITYSSDRDIVYDCITHYRYILTNPSVEDIEKIREQLKQVRFMIKEIYWNIFSCARRELGEDVRFYKGTGASIVLFNHKIAYLAVYAELGLPSDPSKRISIRVGFDKLKKLRVNEDVVYLVASKNLTTKITITRNVKFRSMRYLYDALEVRDGGNPLYNIEYTLSTWDASFSYSVMTEGIGIPFGIKKLYHIMSSRAVFALLKEEVWRNLEKDKDKVILGVGKKNQVTVKDFLEFLRWRNGQDLDEVLFKLSVASLELQGFINIYDHTRIFLSRLVSLAVLDGYDERKVLQAVEKPIETLMELAQTGKIKVIFGKEDTRIKFKGKNLSRVLSLNKLNRNTVVPLIKAIVSMYMPRKKLEWIKKSSKHTRSKVSISV